MQKFYNKYGHYLIAGIGFLATVLLTIAIIVLNKQVFTTDTFKLFENSDSIKRTINNLLGFSDGVVVIGTFILFLLASNKKNDDENDEK